MAAAQTPARRAAAARLDALCGAHRTAYLALSLTSQPLASRPSLGPLPTGYRSSEAALLREGRAELSGRFDRSACLLEAEPFLEFGALRKLARLTHQWEHLPHTAEPERIRLIRERERA